MPPSCPKTKKARFSSHPYPQLRTDNWELRTLLARTATRSFPLVPSPPSPRCAAPRSAHAASCPARAASSSFCPLIPVLRQQRRNHRRQGLPRYPCRLRLQFLVRLLQLGDPLLQFARQPLPRFLLSRPTLLPPPPQSDPPSRSAPPAARLAFPAPDPTSQPQLASRSAVAANCCVISSFMFSPLVVTARPSTS